MRRSKTHFEQVPVAVIKEKIVKGLVEPEDNGKEAVIDIDIGNVSHGGPEAKTEPYSVTVGLNLQES
jgi:hypothetical protein